MFGNHGLCGLLEEGAHEKFPKCLGGNLGYFGGILQRSLFHSAVHYQNQKQLNVVKIIQSCVFLFILPFYSSRTL